MMHPFALFLPAAVCACAFVFFAVEAAAEARTWRARLRPDRKPFFAHLARAAICLAATAIAMVPPIAHAIATGAAR